MSILMILWVMLIGIGWSGEWLERIYSITTYITVSNYSIVLVE